MIYIDLCMFIFHFVANWAQVSGNIDQTVTFPQIPTPEFPHWDGRYGMSSVVFPAVSIYIYINI